MLNVFPIFHSSEENAYTKAIYELTDIINLRIRTFPYHNKLIFDLSPHGFKLRKNRSVIISHTGEIQDAETLQDSITMLQQLSMILRFKDEVIRKRTEALKEEKEMERVRGKRQLDFLDILLLSRVRHVTLLKFPFKGPTSCLSLYSSNLVKQDTPSCGSPGHIISGVIWD